MLKYIIISVAILLGFLAFSYLNDHIFSLRKIDVVIALIPVIIGLSRTIKRGNPGTNK